MRCGSCGTDLDDTQAVMQAIVVRDARIKELEVGPNGLVARTEQLGKYFKEIEVRDARIKDLEVRLEAQWETMKQKDHQVGDYSGRMLGLQARIKELEEALKWTQEAYWARCYEKKLVSVAPTLQEFTDKIDGILRQQSRERTIV